MKTIAAKTNVNNNEQCKNLRFVAISATIPNIEDVCLIKLTFNIRI
jgi:replicative superfamily II helicase